MKPAASTDKQCGSRAEHVAAKATLADVAVNDEVTVTYEMNGETYEDAGSDILALARCDGRWLITWRAMLPAVPTV